MSDFTDLEEILNNKQSYITPQMAEFSIDDVTYRQYGTYTFYWQKTYVESPERSNDGSMGNLNQDNATFNTPHLKVTYDIMTIDAYRALMNQHLNKNEFIVTCYDTINDVVSKHKMYLATEQEPNYYVQNWTDSEGKEQTSLVGVKNYTIELIGTNNPLN